MSKTFVVLLIIFICIGLILVGFLNRFIGVVISRDRTELYSHVSQQGYEVKVYQIGYRMLTSKHHLLIQVNGEDIVEFEASSRTETRLYPVQHIQCEIDNGNKYRISFLKYNGDGFEYFEFNANFSEIVTSYYEFSKLSDQVFVKRIL